MKISGAEFKDWERTAWPKGYIWADESKLEDGRDLYVEDGEEGELIIADTDTFIIPDWWSVIREEEAHLSEGSTIRSLIRKWRKQRDSETLIVTVPKAAVGDARVLLTERGWKVS